MKTDCGIYIHIPFCASKCFYCDFYSRVSTPDIRENYVAALCRQIESHARISPRTVYIGGGTPSVLSSEQLTRISDSLKKTFDMSSVDEFTIEMNPESVSDEFLAAAVSGGCNRASVGIQSFNDEELRLCGRRHTSDTARLAIEKIRNVGIENISADFIIGLPGQTEESLLASLKEAVALKIPHISAYILKVEEGTVFSAKKVPEPDEDTAATLYLSASDFLLKNGYEHYEVSNFALPQKRALHNSSYWQGKNYVAFGAGAYGFENGVRYHLPADLNSFSSKITDEYVADGSEYFLLSLRTSDGVSCDKMDERMLKFASELQKNGLGRFFGDRFALTPKGFLVSNAVIAEFTDG